MTEERVEEARHSGEADLSGLQVRRDIVNLVGSLPSFLSRSGRSLRRAFMNQLQIYEQNESNVD